MTDPKNYKEWLKESNLKDTKENKDWYESPDDKKSDYIKDNPKWWKNF